jgi:hypothetical protein
MLSPTEAAFFAAPWKRVLYITILMAITVFSFTMGADYITLLIAGFTGYMAHAMFPAFPKLGGGTAA